MVKGARSASSKGARDFSKSSKKVDSIVVRTIKTREDSRWSSAAKNNIKKND